MFLLCWRPSQADDAIAVVATSIDADAKSGDLWIVSLRAALATIAGLQDLLEFGASHGGTPQERTEPKSPADILEENVAFDSIIDTQCAGIDEGEIGSGLAESTTHLVDNEISPAALGTAYRFLTGIHR